MPQTCVWRSEENLQESVLSFQQSVVNDRFHHRCGKRQGQIALGDATVPERKRIKSCT